MIAPASVPDYTLRFSEKRETWLASSAKNAQPLRVKRHPALEIERVLKGARLTMVELSARTRMRFGEESPYFIPPTFLHKQRAGITPHICQVVALSEITGYRFTDWMKLWGFDLGLILELQLKIPNERTIILAPGRDFARINASEQSNSGAQWHKKRYC